MHVLPQLDSIWGTVMSLWDLAVYFGYVQHVLSFFLAREDNMHHSPKSTSSVRFKEELPKSCINSRLKFYEKLDYTKFDATPTKFDENTVKNGKSTSSVQFRKRITNDLCK